MPANPVTTRIVLSIAVAIVIVAGLSLLTVVVFLDRSDGKRVPAEEGGSATLPTSPGATEVEDRATEAEDTTGATSSGVQGQKGGGQQDTGTVPIMLTIHMETHESIPCDVRSTRCKTDEEFGDMMGVVETLVASLNDTGLKGTFQFQITWMTRLSESDRGRKIIQSVLDGGHEIGLHHHGFDHNDWDGYSDNPEAQGSSMGEYMQLVHDFEKEWGIEISTVEGTDLRYDGQDEWIIHTSDDPRNPEQVELHDPDGACPTGRPTWSVVSLPNTIKKLTATGGVNIGHTWMAWRTGECVQVLSENILGRIDDINLEGLSSDQLINVVFHPSDYGATSETIKAFDQFFHNLSTVPELKAMTAQQIACERLRVCDF